MRHYIIDSRTARVFLRETGIMLLGYAANCVIGGVPAGIRQGI